MAGDAPGSGTDAGEGVDLVSNGGGGGNGKHAWKAAKEAGGEALRQYKRAHQDDGGAGGPDPETGGNGNHAWKTAQDAGGEALRKYKRTHDQTPGNSEGDPARQPRPEAVDEAQNEIESAYQQHRDGTDAAIDLKLLKTKAGQEAVRNARGDLYEHINVSGQGDAGGTLQQRLVLQQMFQARLNYVKAHHGGEKLVGNLKDAIVNQRKRIARLGTTVAEQSIG